MKQVNRPFLLAITGGIASGKSTVSHWFEQHNFTVYYADKIGHQILSDPSIIMQLTDTFRDRITQGNSIDRAKLGEFVFSNPKKLEKLNSILHPAIRKRMQDLINQSTDKLLFFEIPLLFEGGLDKSFDLVINVHVSLETQIQRLIIRNGFSRKEAEQRINSQLPAEIKMKQADVNVDNNETLVQLRNQLEELLNNLDSFSHKKVESLI